MLEGAEYGKRNIKQGEGDEKVPEGWIKTFL